MNSELTREWRKWHNISVYETGRPPGSIIITSNKAFSEWGQVFTDDVLATAILDRYLHHCDVITINGPSWRMKNQNPPTDTNQHMP